MRCVLLGSLLGVCLCVRLGLAVEENKEASALADAGITMLAAGKTEKGQNMLFKSLAYDSHCALALYELGKLFEAEGNTVSAADFLSQAAVELAKGEAVNKDYALKRSDATRRLQKLNPWAMQFTQLLEEYAQELCKINKKIPDTITTEEIGNRVDALHLAALLPKEKLPTLERTPKADAVDNNKNNNNSITINNNRIRFSNDPPPAASNVPPDVELALKKDGWKTIAGVWKKKGEKIYEVTDGKLEAPITSGAIGALVHKGGTATVKILVRHTEESGGGRFSFNGVVSEDFSGFGAVIKGSNCDIYTPSQWFTMNGNSWSPWKEKSFALPDASPKNQVLVTVSDGVKDSKLEITVNGSCQRRGSFVGLAKEGTFVILIQGGTATIETPQVAGK